MLTTDHHAAQLILDTGFLNWGRGMCARGSQVWQRHIVGKQDRSIFIVFDCKVK